MKTAVKEALQAKQAELEQVTEHVREQVLAIAQTTVEKLQEMDPQLAAQLQPRFAAPNWAKVFGISLTDDADIPINKRGSGVRRLVLVSFFRAKAEQSLHAGEAPGIIYAVEEPETSQHPDNQKLLVGALRELSEQPGCQVLTTTHTPLLARDVEVSSLRYVERHDDGTRTVHAYDEETYNRVSKALGVIPDHDVRLFIGVEGVNDIDFVKGIAKMLKDAGEDVPDLVAAQLHVNGGTGAWEAPSEEKRKKKVSRAKRRLNTDAVAAMTPALLTAVDPDGDVRGWLEQIRQLHDQ